MIRSGEILSQQPGLPKTFSREPRSDGARNAYRLPTRTLGEPYDPFAGQVSVFEGPSLDFASLNIGDYSPLRRPLQAPSSSEASSLFAPRRAAPDDASIGIRRDSQEGYLFANESPPSGPHPDFDWEPPGGHAFETPNAPRRDHRPLGRSHHNPDEFDGQTQFLPLPVDQRARAGTLPQLPVHLSLEEQDIVVQRANDILAECAFYFVARYQFPIPLEREKPRVEQPADRDWTEWAYLLKRLATKRRIPARFLFENQIKQFVTRLENSLVVRQTPSRRSDQMIARQPRDDRYMLQLISAGIQVAKILMDSVAMGKLNDLYLTTEAVVLERRNNVGRRGSDSSSGGGGVGGSARGMSGGRGSMGVAQSTRATRGVVGGHSVGSGAAGY